uniref:Uncharacterized protein n=1 Tax=Zea mays TaxID=4577 RepID=C0PCG3_MAIZE|nr:unknown [Zea mays]
MLKICWNLNQAHYTMRFYTINMYEVVAWLLLFWLLYRLSPALPLLCSGFM